MPVPSKEAGLLLEHADVITLDPGRPRAEAVLCRNGVIEAIGTNEELEGLLRDDDTRFDCGELPLVPGFFDSHTHFMAMGLNELRVDLAAVEDLDGLFEVLSDRATRTRESEWIYGVGFDETRWSGDHSLPTREELDERVSSTNPVVARRICGHVAVANSAALERIGPSWEKVDRSTGLLLEDVVLRLSEVVGVTDDEARKGLDLAFKMAYEHGVTSVLDMTDIKTLATYMDMDASGELGLRIFCAIQARDLDVAAAAGLNPDHNVRTGLLKLAGVKAFLDGSLGARTAALGEPYADDVDDPTNRGMLLYSPEELRDLVRQAEEMGLQMFLHAIGDRAIGMALDAIEAEAAPGNPLRHRVEHMEVPTPEQLDRIKDLRVVASMQPNFIVQWSDPGGMNEQRLGPERARTSEGLRDVWGRGIPLAFGSDCMPFGPLYGLQGAIHHPVEEQALPPMVALRAYTHGSAWAARVEDFLGTVEVGKAADLVLLNDDIEQSQDLRAVKVVLTVLGGFIVHVDSAAFNDAMSIHAEQALEAAIRDMDLPRLDLDGPLEDDEDNE